MNTNKHKDPYDGWEKFAPGMNDSSRWNGNNFYRAKGKGKKW